MTLSPDELTQIILKELSQEISEHPGLPAVVANRSKFEGWMKVELCGVLAPHGSLIPEWKRFDLLFDHDWVMELKTFCTNYRDPRVVKKAKPIKQSIDELLVQIDHLKQSGLPHQAVIFVAYPLLPGEKYWVPHLKKISAVISTLEFRSFNFADGVAGILYVGVV